MAVQMRVTKSLMDTAPPAVSIRGVTRAYGEARALNDVSVDVAQGEFFSLLGPSGCGKTTLLRIIGGFDHPTAGDVMIMGRSVLADPPYLRRTNMVFQHMALFPHLSVARNISFGLEIAGMPREIIKAKVGEMLDLVRLPGMGERRIEMLSGGQKQRVAIARALVNSPDVLLLDEPLSALDLQLRLRMHDELRRIHREIRKTFIFVTHDQGEAITLSDRIAVMSGGRIVQLGSPNEIYERPRTRFVAEFIGHSNFVEAPVLSCDPDGRCVLAREGLTIEGRADELLAPGSKAIAVLRHEKIEVADERPGAAGAAGTIVEETYLGQMTRSEILLASGLTLTSATSNIGIPVRRSPGTRVLVRWHPDTVVVLPA